MLGLPVPDPDLTRRRGLQPRLRHLTQVLMRNVIPPLDMDALETVTHVNGGPSSSACPGEALEPALEDPSNRIPAKRSGNLELTRHDAELIGAVSLRSLPSCYFEIRVPGWDGPVYVSEVTEHSTNPTWLPVRSTVFDRNMLRAGVIMLSAWYAVDDPTEPKFYGKPNSRRFAPLLRETEIDLAGLVYLGKDVGSTSVP